MSRPSVLLVDDRVDVRQTLKSVLARYGCDIVEAADGETALALLATTLFDVIFLDLKLPDLSGIEVLRRARERRQPFGRVIVLTGFLEPAATEETAKLGAFRHLTKDPISYSEVREAFDAAVSGDGPPPAPAREPAVEHTSHVPAPHARARPADKRRHDPRPHVLVLDDQVAWLDTIERMLGDDFAVVTTTDPEDACKQARDTHFDIVILDILLSGDVTGLEVLTRMAEWTLDLKAIILTGVFEDEDEAKLESGRRGARMFVRKSHLATLPDKVREILNDPPAPPSVFLSYDRRDKRRVRELYRRLKKAGVRPWMDTEDLLPGAKVDPSIETRIQASDHFVFCHSRHSWDKEGMIRWELNLALERLPRFREEKHYLIVLRLDETRVVGSLLRFHHVELFRPGGFQKLLRAIAADAPRK
jgi:CheY-like chemotaxis protein